MSSLSNRRSGTRKYAPRVLAAMLPLVAVVACGEVPILEQLSPDRTCRRTMVVGTAREVDVEWVGPDGADQRQQLNAWCAAVGPAVFGGWAPAPAEPVDSIAFVSWNVHVGGGELRRLVRDLREGVLTRGRRVEHFVLLLQEAYREDDTVPAFDPALPLGSAVTAVPPGGAREDIATAAEALGLSIFYAPSMRNGVGRGDESPEDRGNAILSTLPLAEPLAIELPVARQRRVAVGARVILGPPTKGTPVAAPADSVSPAAAAASEAPSVDDATPDDDAPSYEDAPFIHAISVHLENDASGWGGDERARLSQTRALLRTIPDADAAVAGGDFNTWTRGRDEALVSAMLSAFPDTPPFPAGHTYTRAYGLLRRYLDYLFFRLPDGADSDVRIVPDPYASDHYPVVGFVSLP